ncbi:FimV N-terminal domain [Gallionella capsiferriformans ES-2]|uniref:FimV N-terminal domain n=2 Tax=Gallionella TaxID=96 RepID=D9SC74_GALCS|nr:FimV N-terminal domain [Gallionella capsiferriformans ES-2]
MKCTNMPRKLMVQLLGMTAGLSLSVLSYAVGLGGINVVSALGQPLKAEIELVAVSGADKPSLVARLASPDAYKGAGLEYPFGVKYSFEVGSRANGDPYLKLNSNREINDPFVSLLVELSWSSGRLMREYTFLLDPPGYVVAQPKAAAVEPLPAAVVESTPLEAAPVKPEEAVPVAVPVEKTVSRPAVRASRSSSDEITVKSGDTLNKIASEVKPADISLERMLVALYRANADQFDGKNMNRIKTGKILRMPDRDEVAHLVQSEAVREIHAQSADWNSYRQKLAGAALTTPRSESNKQVATGKISAPALDKTPLATESAKEVLRLSKGEMPGNKRAEAARAAQDKRNAAAEEAIAKAQADKEEQARAALLEANMKDMQRLAQLKAEAAALIAGAASQAAASEVAEVAPESAVAAVSEVAAASAVASEVVAASAPVEVEGPSLMDRLQENATLLGLGAAALLALAGGIAIKRRKQQSGKAGKPAEDNAGASTGLLTVPVMPSPDTGDFTTTGADEIVPSSDEVDPISEADLFLNFGRDEQAEEVLKDALQHSPDNHEIHLKLLGIYAKHQNAAAFAEISGLLEKTGDRDAIEQAGILAMQLADAPIEDVGTATQLMDAFEVEARDMEPVEEPVVAISDLVESELESELAPEAEPEAEQPISAETLDFDVTSTHPVPTPEVDFDVTSTSAAIPDVLDFDIATNSSVSEVPEEESLPSLDDLIFDVTSSNSVSAEAVASIASAPEDDGMEFTLDFPLDDVKDMATPSAPAINLSDISLDMDDVAVPVVEVSEAPKSEQWHEVATKLDLARAYQEMGDEVGSREILDEVMREGDTAQQHEAELLIKQLG